MPCYSTIPTLLLRIEFIEAAASLLELGFEQVSETTLVIRQDRTRLVLGRSNPESKFSVQVGSSIGDYREILDPLVIKYAEQVVEDFALQNGYLVTPGDGVNQLQLVSIS